jgi:hypothetical protein
VRVRVHLQTSILCSRSTIGIKLDIQNSSVCSNKQVAGNNWLIFAAFDDLIFFCFIGKKAKWRNSISYKQ